MTVSMPDNPRVEVRPILESEIDATAAMWHASQVRAYSWFRADQFHPRADALRYFRESVCTRCDVFVAEADGGIVGVLALDGTFLDHLFVHADFWGRCIGSRLLEYAKALRPEGLTLVTLQRNERARRFYERRGFVVTKTGTSPPPENEPDVFYAWTGDRSG